MTLGQPRLPLIAFFEAVFLPLQLRGRSPAYCEQYRVAIRWLAALVHHEPLLSDLNRETITAFVARLAALRLSPATTRNIRRRLWALWRYAHQLGYADQPPSIDRRRKVPSYRHHKASGQAFVQIAGQRHYLGRFGEHQSRMEYLKMVTELEPRDELPDPPEIHIERVHRPWNTPTAAKGTLLLFYRAVFRPELAPQISARDVSKYDCAINYLHDFVGQQISLDDVTPELVLSFRTWLDGLPVLGAGQRSAYIGAIRRIMRASPRFDRFPSRDGMEPLSIVGPEERARAAGATRRRLPPLIGESGTLLHFFAAAYLPQAIPTCSDAHRRQFDTLFRKLRRCFGHDIRLASLGREAVADFRFWLREDGCGPFRIRNLVGQMLAVWRFAEELGQAPPVPRFRKVRIPRDAPDAWSIDELKRIVDAAGQLERPPIGGVAAGKYWRAILLVGYWTALRRGSLLKIRTMDLDLAGWLNVPGSQIKNASGMRLRIGADAAAAVAEIFDPLRELLFPSPAELSTLSHHFRAIIAAAGVPPSPLTKGLFHKLRRSAITHTAVRAGMAAAITLAGHSAQYITERYIDPRFLPNHDATAWLPAIGGPGSEGQKGGPTPAAG